MIAKQTFYCLLFIIIGGVTIFGQEVKICDDIVEWPPYLYYKRTNGTINKTEFTGAVKELYDEIFKQVGLEYSVSLLPWKRCMLEVEKYDVSQKYEIISNGSYSPNRVEKYWPSIPLYSTHRGVFYSEKKFPQGLSIKNKSDVIGLRICGVNGYSYSDIFTWDENIKIDQGAKSNGAALKKIALGRCDIMITSMEPIYGAVAIGKFKMPPGIKSFPMPGLPPSTFHFWISRKSPRALELLAALNTAVMNSIYSGKYTEIFTKYFPKKSHLYE